MRRVALSCLIGGAAFWFTAAAMAVVATVIEALIRDLGAPQFQTREQASAALRRAGPEAIPLLERAAQSDDPEIRQRARAALADLRLGIGVDWPPDLVDRVRRFESLAPGEQTQTLQDARDRLREQAIPFLVTRLSGSPTAETALKLIRDFATETAAQQTLAWLNRPRTAGQQRAILWACRRLDRLPDALARLAGAEVRDDSLRRELGDAVSSELRRQLADHQFARAAELAAQAVTLLKDDARLLYLQAEALAGAGQTEAAEARRRDALALHPDEEAPHYTAGELLLQLNRPALSAREWELILRIPPADDVYDINALLRLSNIRADERMWTEAADLLQKALDLYRQARKQHGAAMGIAGGDEASLERRIQHLRLQALGNADKEAPPADQPVSLHIDVRIKDGQLGDLRKALAATAHTVTMTVQPLGFRLFDVDAAGLRYDTAKRQLQPLLNGQPASRAVDLPLTPGHTRIAIRQLDCIQIFEVDPGTGECKKIARFEKDYVVQLKPGPETQQWKDVSVTINGKPYDWRELLKGVTFDYLPEQFELHLEATNADGKRQEFHQTYPLREVNED